MRIINYAFWLFVILLGIGFTTVNSRSVEIHYYLGVVHIYLPLLLLIELAFGVLLGVIAMLPKQLKTKVALRKARSKLRRLEKEIHFPKSCSDQQKGD